MQSFNTKQGIFGPGGHGGGIFQTTVAGLGSFNTKQGIFGPGGHGGGIFQTTVSGLGATGLGGVPAQCWDWPGFKNCHTNALTATHHFCKGLHVEGSAGFKDCYSKVSAEKIQLDCVLGLGCGVSSTSASSTTTTAMASLPWGTYNGTTKLVQKDANRFLPGLGYPLISTDGKLGGKTCAVIKLIIDKGKIKGWVMPKACAGRVGTLSRATVATTPAPTPSPTPSSTPSPISPTAYKPPMGTGTKLLIAGAGVLLAVGGFAAWKKYRK